MQKHVFLYIFLCKYDFYLRDLNISNLKEIFKSIFERKIFIVFLYFL
jgi:hypothetical protein